MNLNSTSEQEFLTRLSEITEAKLENEHFGVSELAREMGMSRSNLHRKIHALLKISASQFINQARLKKGMELLRQTSFTVSEVAYKVGFGSVTYFIKCFHDYYGYSPGGIGNRDETETETEIAKSNKKRLTVIVSSVVFVVLIVVVLFVVVKPFSFQQKELEKSIAVLPFKNDSPDSTNAHINGLMESILNNLQIIEELDVKSRTSVEQYRKTTESVTKIARELNVNYIVEGSGAKYGDEIVLNIQLLDARSDRHLLSETYQRQIKEVKDYIDIQAEIAFDIASKIKAELSQKEKELIEQRPTENLLAYEHYQRGDEYGKIAHSTQALYNQAENRRNFRKAKTEFEKAIVLDSNFAEPYVRLSNLYINVFAFTNNIELESAYLDSGLFLAEKVLSLENVPELDYSWALNLKGTYYQKKGMRDEAMKYFKQQEKYIKQRIDKSEQWGTYRGLAVRNAIFEEYSEAIKNAFQFIKNNPIEEKPRYIFWNPFLTTLITQDILNRQKNMQKKY